MSSGTVARLAGLDVDDLQLVERLIEDVPRVALPAGRVRALGGHAARRPERLAACATPATPPARLRRSPPSSCRQATTPGRRRRASRSTASESAHTTSSSPPAAEIVRTWLVPSRKRTRHRRDAGERDALAVGRPGRRARLRQRVVNLRDRAGGDVEHRHLRPRATCRRR